jgi:tripartite-type tricarboxylate transporter receptor subunit TctC
MNNVTLGVRRRELLGAACALPVGLAAPAAAWATAYPNRPITLLLGFPAGGSSDTVMRIIAEEMSRQLGQRVNVDNRAGAGGLIATQVALAAPPDGYTVLFAGLQLSTAPHLNAVRYKPESDLAMLGKVANVPVLLLGAGNSKLNSAADITALAVSARPATLVP